MIRGLELSIPSSRSLVKGEGPKLELMMDHSHVMKPS